MARMSAHPPQLLPDFGIVVTKCMGAGRCQIGMSDDSFIGGVWLSLPFPLAV